MPDSFFVRAASSFSAIIYPKGSYSGLHDKNGRHYSAAYLAFSLSSWIRITAFAIYFANQNALAYYGLFLTIKQLATTVFQPFAGSIADKYQRQTVLKLACLADIALNIGVILIVTGSQKHAVLEILIALSFSTFSKSLFDATYNTSLARDFSKDIRQSMNVLKGTISTGTLIVGPALTGGLILKFGMATAIQVDTALIFLVFLAIFGAKNIVQSDPEMHIDAAPKSMIKGILESYKYAFKRKTILGLSLLFLASNLGASSTYLLVPQLVKSLHANPGMVGFTLSFVGIGSLLGMVIGGSLTVKKPFLVCVISWSAFSLMIFLWGSLADLFSNGIYIVGFFVGLFACIPDVLFWTALQNAAPEHMAGRVISSADSIALTGLSLGPGIFALTSVYCSGPEISCALGIAMLITIIIACVQMKRKNFTETIQEGRQQP